MDEVHFAESFVNLSQSVLRHIFGSSMICITTSFLFTLFTI